MCNGIPRATQGLCDYSQILWKNPCRIDKDRALVSGPQSLPAPEEDIVTVRLQVGALFLWAFFLGQYRTPETRAPKSPGAVVPIIGT
jgi:hypothetical protein